MTKIKQRERENTSTNSPQDDLKGKSLGLIAASEFPLYQEAIKKSGADIEILPFVEFPKENQIVTTYQLRTKDGTQDERLRAVSLFEKALVSLRENGAVSPETGAYHELKEFPKAVASNEFTQPLIDERNREGKVL